jgi:hypothetical protein
MGSRLALQAILESLLGSRNVYFQPPASVTMQYPAIVYSLATIDNTFANNIVYTQERAYQITVVDKNPESAISSRVSKLAKCRFNRFFVSDNLNHWVYNLYF